MTPTEPTPAPQPGLSDRYRIWTYVALTVLMTFLVATPVYIAVIFHDDPSTPAPTPRPLAENFQIIHARLDGVAQATRKLEQSVERLERAVDRVERELDARKDEVVQ